MTRSRRRRWWTAAIALAVIAVIAIAYVVLSPELDGPDLGLNIATLLNKRMRGRIEIGSVERDGLGVSNDGWVPVRAHDVRVWDDCALSAVAGSDPSTGDPNQDCTPDDRPDADPKSRRRPRKLLIDAPEITAEINVRALVAGNHNVTLRNVRVHGGEALIEETLEPYPLHDYNRKIVSIVTAFYPRMQAGFRSGIYADSPPPIFDLRDIHVEHLNLTVHVGPYSPAAPAEVGYNFAARIEDVNVDAGAEPSAPHAANATDSYLYMDPTDPVIAKFYVRLAAQGKLAHLRLRDEGRRDAFRIPSGDEAYPPPGRSAFYELELRDIDLRRLAQLPTDWARRDVVANTLELDLSAHAIPCGDGSAAAPAPTAANTASLRMSGELRDYWDRPYDGAWNLVLDAKNLGQVLHTCIKPKISGDHLDGTITLTGPFVADPKVGLDLRNLDVAIPITATDPPLELTLAEVHGSIDLVNDVGKIDKTKALIRGGKEPGEVDLAATFALAPYSVNASIDISKPIDAYRFLPASLRDSGGHFISGHLHATGDVDYGFALDELDLSLGLTPTSRSFRVHSGRLFTNNDFDRIDIDKVKIEAGQSHASVSGWVDTAHGTMHIPIDGDFPDLGVWLKRFGMPQFAASAGGGRIVLDGRLTDPTVDVSTELGGVPCLDKLKLSARLKDGVADVESFSSAGFGGSVTGNARIRYGDAVPVIEKMHVSGKQLAAAKVCGMAGVVDGTLAEVDVDLHGAIDKARKPIDWLDYASVYARADHLDVLGDAYAQVALCVNRKDDGACRPRAQLPDGSASPDDDRRQCTAATAAGGFCAVATAARSHGGTFDATIAKFNGARAGKQAVPAHVVGTVSIDDLPISALEPLIGPGTAGGVVSTRLHLGGSPNAPTATGYLDMLRTWVKGAFVGDAQLAVEPTTLAGAPAIVVHGSLLAGRLGISATVGTRAPYPAEVVITVHRLELTPFVDVAAKLHLPDPVDAWASGTITVRTELAPAGGTPPQPDAWIELSELRIVDAHRAHDGGSVPIALTLVAPDDPTRRAAMSLHMTKTLIEFACRDRGAAGGSVPCNTVLESPAGNVVLGGRATESDVTLHADGTLDFGKLATLLDTQFEDLTGGGQLHAAVSGSIDHPSYEVGFELADLRMRPLGADTVVRVPSGLVKFANGALGFNDVVIRVDGDRDGGEIRVHGTVGFDLADGVHARSWGVLVDGTLPGKLMTALGPLNDVNPLSQATGALEIDPDEPIALMGRGTRPLVRGHLKLGGAHPLAITPRGVHQELAFVAGGVELSTVADGDHRVYDADFEDMDATINRDGKVNQIRGEVIIRDRTLARAYVTLDADNLQYKVPGVLDIALAAHDVTIELADERAPWVVSGGVIVQSGAYIRNFELTDAIIPSAPVAKPVRPFWEEYPTLGNAVLNHVELSIEKFDVKNNIARIAFSGRTIITGTPRDPRLAGQITTTQGTFRIPATRADFTRTVGSITFQEDRSAADPKLDVTSDAPDYRDLTGQSHDVTLTITGTLNEPRWDLKTSTGYDKSQTLALLLLGRNPEQLRRSLGDQTLGADPTHVDPSTNPSSQFADQITKDLAGDWVSSLLGNSLTRLTGLDVLRFELGFGSIGVHAEKKAVENVTLLGDGEETIRGSTIDVRAVWRTPFKALFPSDRFEVQAGYLRKVFIDPAEEDIYDEHAQLVYKLIIP